MGARVPPGGDPARRGTVMNPARRRILQQLAGASLVAWRFDAAVWAGPSDEGDVRRAAGDERTFAGIRACWCPPGRFTMGSPATETGRRADEAQVEVQLTRGFWMGKFEITQAEWTRVVGRLPSPPPSAVTGLGADVPVYWVSYDDATRFCDVATALGRADASVPVGWAFGLPSEAQWEYACRAGTTSATAFGDTLAVSRANFDPAAETRGRPLSGTARPVGCYAANAWGLHDMHGNVWEWCRDYYHGRLPGGVDPDLSRVPGERNGDGTHSRIRRGGAWIESARFCRCAARLRYEPHRSSDHIGFRIIVAEV